MKINDKHIEVIVRQMLQTGLKENVIVGRLIPAGTGSVMNRLRAIAAGRAFTSSVICGVVSMPRVR